MAYTQSNEIKTRISLKYDTLTNWTTANPILLAGEVAIATISSADPANKQHPPVMFKVGPGNFNDLEWASALAADVYSWAKESAINVTKNGTGNVVASIAWDATLNGGKGGIKYETASVATSEGLQEVQNTLNGLVQTVNGMYTNAQIDAAIKVVADDLAEHEEAFEAFKTTNAQAIANAKSGAEATAADALSAARAELESDIEAAQDTADEALTKINTFMETAETDDEVVNTLQEIIALINSEDAELSTALMGEINGLKGKFDAEGKALDADKLDGHDSTYFATAEQANGIAQTIGAYGDIVSHNVAEFATAAQGTKADNAAAAIATYGDIVTHNVAEFATAAQGTKADNAAAAIATYGDIVTHNVSEFATAAQGAKADTAVQPVANAIAGNLAGVDANGNLTDSGYKVVNAAGANVNTAIPTQNLTQTLIQTMAISKQTLRPVDEIMISTTGGEITNSGKKLSDLEAAGTAAGLVNTLDASLATVAKTGNIADLVQTADTYVWFNCGSATTVI